VILEVDERFTITTAHDVEREQEVNVSGWDFQHLLLATDAIEHDRGSGSSHYSRGVKTIRLQR
jgi:hypothetical protein